MKSCPSVFKALLLLGGIITLPAAAAQLTLSTGWSLQSSTKATQTGSAISTAGFQATGWYPITMPATVIAGLLQNNVYADPFYSKNLSLINPADFTPAWWYRTEFTLASGENGKRIWLKLEGLNYRANVWFNGTQLSTTTSTVGPFRSFEFDVTSLVNYTGSNALAVQVSPPVNYSSDLTVFFVDWSPTPPDKNMGILNDVVVSTSGPANIRHPLVSTKFDLPSLSVAHLTVAAEVTNGSNSSVSGTVDGTIGAISFSQPITLAAHQTLRVTFTPAAYPQLNVTNPSIWWPWEYGTPNLNTLNLSVSLGGQLSDSLTAQFGIRQITSALNSGGSRVFSINGKPILIRGAAWSPDMFQRRSPARQEAEVRYARDLNFNTLRFEGKFEDENMFQLTDRYGLLVMIGWCCCDAWQNSSSWNAEQTTVGTDSLRNQMYRLRIHPSMLVWLNGSDETAASSVEQSYVNIESDLQWPSPTIACAADRSTTQEGPTGVKMNGPYDYEPPAYWETDTGKVGGGAWNFSTEISPGADVPPIESLQQFIPAANLWPIGSYWTFHCGQDVFGNLDVFTNAMTKRYGAATSAADYAAKAQISTYESHRAMFEAYGRHKYTSTGIIQWMMNNAWPGMFWHVYDYYLRPGGTYFGVKNALEPLHIQYSYVNKTITVLNSTLQSYSNLTAAIQVYNLDGTQKYTHSTAVSSVGPDSTNDIFTLPSISGLTTTYFLRLTLTDASSNVVSINTYWLSTKTDVVNWSTYGNPWQYTPQSAYADLTALATMPAASITYSQQIVDSGTQRIQTVTLTNTGSTIAFFVRLKINKSTTGDEVLPILWQDNYVTLLPGESRPITATYFISDLGGASPVLQIVPYLSNVTVAPAGGGSTAATPAFNPVAGTYSTAQSVTISTATSSASIRYTTDGSTPSETAGTLYSGPVSVSSTTTLKAIAYATGFTDSPVASATYTISTGGGPITLEAESLSPVGTGATVSISNDANASGGVVEFLNSTAAGQTMTLTTPGIAAGTYQVQLRYKTNTSRGQLTIKIDGSQVGGTVDQYATTSAYTSVNLGNATLAASGAHTIVLTVTGKNASATQFYITADTLTFTPVNVQPQAAAPTFSPAAGTYSTAQSVTISTATSGAIIRYTTDGSTPNETAGTVYSGPVSISANTTLEAIAYETGFTDSAVTSGTYTITTPPPPQVATPVFSPAAGTYPTTQSVTITTSTSGATLRYTTDGSTPSETVGTIYSGPVSISSTTTLKAIGYETGFTDSVVTSATYTISAGPPPTVSFEAESLSPVGTGATVSISNDANASGGVVEFLNSTAAGQTMTLTTPSIAAGTYQVQLRYKTNTSRGQLTVKIDGTQVGGTLDEYATTQAYLTATLGNATLATGTHTIVLTVTGKNSSATQFYLTADKFTFVGQ